MIRVCDQVLRNGYVLGGSTPTHMLFFPSNAFFTMKTNYLISHYHVYSVTPREQHYLVANLTSSRISSSHLHIQVHCIFPAGCNDLCSGATSTPFELLVKCSFWAIINPKMKCNTKQTFSTQHYSLVTSDGVTCLRHACLVSKQWVTWIHFDKTPLIKWVYSTSTNAG